MKRHPLSISGKLKRGKRKRIFQGKGDCALNNNVPAHHSFLKQLSCQKRPRNLTPPRYMGRMHLKHVPLERRHSAGRVLANLYLMIL